MRTGFGFDSHLFGVKGTLKLGGVAFPGLPALAGHSDGDALIHAVIDALLGAAGLGDIGRMFSDRSKKFKGISSLILLQRAMKVIRARNLTPTHIDVTVVAQKPRLSKMTRVIAARLAKVIGVSAAHINIKAKTPEGLTWFQKPGGIAVWAVANCE